MREISTNPSTLLRTGALDAHDGKCCARGSFDSYVQDALAAKEEALIAAYCMREGLDYASLTDAEKCDLLEFAQADCEQEIADNGFGGLGT